MFGFVLSIAAMEVLLHGIEQTPVWRILPVVERELGWPDPDTGYSLRPDRDIINVRENRSRVTTNGFGMRDRSRELAKPSGTYRVVVTGDSFTEALQVDDGSTFTRLAEASLNSDSGRGRFEVLNFGMSGAGPVQQYVRLGETALDFSPDTIVMLINANQLLSIEMSDDSMNPAYVENEFGGLELGYGFRERRSQRYRDTFAGRLFFSLMDHSRVARAFYLRSVHGGALAAAAPNAQGARNTRSCARIDAGLARHLELWRVGEPTRAAARLERLLNDIAAIKNTRRLPIALVFYGIGEPVADCVESLVRRATLVREMSATLESYGLLMWDADDALTSGDPSGMPLSRLRGFGRRVGFGHLNLDGHRAYGALLSEVITVLNAGPPGAGPE